MQIAFTGNAKEIADLVTSLQEHQLVDVKHMTIRSESSPEVPLLKSIPTCQLVEELTGREGVDCFYVEPYEELPISVSGPAVVMVVID